MFDKANQFLDSGDREGAKRLMQKQKEWSKSAKAPKYHSLTGDNIINDFSSLNNSFEQLANQSFIQEH